MEDFIRVWENKVPKELCDSAISTFEKIVNDPKFSNSLIDNTKQFSVSNLGRKDTSFFLGNDEFEQSELCNNFLKYLHECLLEYVEEFGQLKGPSLTNQLNIKFQKTPIMGGYHVWHYETAGPENTYSRELTWMIYLNDMPSGEAETEFLYQRKRISPTRGTIVMWPAGLTHVHRGNTVYTKDKYILTGWYHKVPD